MNCDYAIIGGGVVGLALADAILHRKPDARVVLLEKEADIAQHSSGRNSGVLHSGIYYSESSLKAKFCLDGNRAIKALCRNHKIPMNECGKLVVATRKEELPRLTKIYQQSLKNGCSAEWVTAAEAEKIEPNLNHIGDAIFAPETATVDPVAICQALKQKLLVAGCVIKSGVTYQSHLHGILTTSGGPFEAGMVINAAGLYADRIARDFGFSQDYGILPFKGLYLKYTKNKIDVRTNIYPVPDPDLPFLGVHFTVTVDGTIKIGPTAIPAFWRENYDFHSKFSASEFAEIIGREAHLLKTNKFHFRTLALMEMRKYSKRYFISLAKRLVKNIDEDGFTEFSRPGIRAQLLNLKTGELVQDFVVEGDSKSVHILNAVSPGFTSSLPFAKWVVDNYVFRDAAVPAVLEIA